MHPADVNLIVCAGQGTSQVSNWAFALCRSTNGGTSWTRSFIEQNQMGWCLALAVAPSAPDRIYAGGQVIGSGAVAVSTDRGRTWTRTVAPAETVFGLAVHPGDPLAALAATTGGVYRTTDGGANWSRLLSQAGMRKVAFLPGGPDTVIAGGSRGAYVSRNGGATWTEFNEGIEGRAVVALEFAADDAVRLFAGTGNAAAFRYSFLTGVEEKATAEARASNPGPAIVRGILVLSQSHSPSVLLDASGRKAMNIKPGENDVSRLSPGVYFIRAGGAASAGAGHRVILTR